MSAKPDISVPAASSDAPLRPISFGDPAVSIDRRDDGTIYLRPKIALGEYPLRLTDRLHHEAKAEPNRIFMAERAAGGLWRQISYAQLLASSRHIASGLLARGLSTDKPVVILSGNSIDHALLAFGALYAACALALGGAFLALAWRLRREPTRPIRYNDPPTRRTRRTSSARPG